MLIPVTMSLMTCTTAIVFAVLAARSDVDRAARSVEGFRIDMAQLLICDQFVSLSSEDFNNIVREMMQSHERVFTNLNSCINDLGCTANNTIARLYFSYSTFIIGMFVSVASLLKVIGCRSETGV